MATPLGQEVSTSKLSLLDIAAIAAVKNISERVLTPIIGNGTIMSGVIKTVAGVVASQAIKGKVGDILGVAWVVDGTEDLVTAFLGSGNRSLLGGQKTESVTVL